MDKHEIINVLKTRFENNMKRHENINWKDIEERILKDELKIKTLIKMEKTGGEPDIIHYDKENDFYIYCDCSKETPFNRRGLCYDKEALDSRKTNKPIGDAVSLSNNIGITITTEQEYRLLQETGEYDIKTSSWIKTPKKIRDLKGALFCDRRYDTVFTYHNGAEYYYSSRGFRGILKI